MNNIDFKSVIIGILGTILIFIFLGAQKKEKIYDELNVKVLRLIYDNKVVGVIAGTPVGGAVQLTNNEFKTTISIINNDDGEGHIETFRKNGDQRVYIGEFIATHNKYGNRTTYIGNNDENNGAISINNYNGNSVWGKVGK